MSQVEAGALMARVAALSADERAAMLAGLSERALRAWAGHFADWSHAGQVAPAGDAWRTWVILGGRGFGKTRAGAEWVLAQVRAAAAARACARAAAEPVDGDARPAGGGRGGGDPFDGGAGPIDDGAGGPGGGSMWRADAGAAPRRRTASPPAGRERRRSQAALGPLRIALVGATLDDARAVMADGPSGLLNVARPGEITRYHPAARTITFADGSVATLYSGRSPGMLRGPEHDLAWCDELGKWARAGEAWDMLQLGLRRGPLPRAVVTTTPSAEPALARVLAAAGTVVTGGATGANPHLSPGFAEAVTGLYGGTRLGRQELDGLMPTEREGSLWPAALLDRCRGSAPAADGLRRVVVGVDPPASAAGTCGIGVCGLDEGGVAWVLADASVAGASPDGWARAVRTAAALWGADRVVAEANQGGDMVRRVLEAGGAAHLPLTLVRASRGKAARAEPVAALFEAGRARMNGHFAELEAELSAFAAGGWAGQGSPDRADAMVWALWALCLEGRAAPGVRVP